MTRTQRKIEANNMHRAELKRALISWRGRCTAEDRAKHMQNIKENMKMLCVKPANPATYTTKELFIATADFIIFCV